MELDSLLQLVEKEFPYIPKPKRDEIPFHSDDCPHCLYNLRDLDKYDGERLPREAIRFLFDELSTLSAKGTAWVYPSYLRVALQTNESYDVVPEFLIYNWSPDKEYEKDTVERLSFLSKQQVECLLEIIGYWQGHEHWGSFCEEELGKAREFIARLV